MTEKILIVDDELDTLRLIGLMLEKQGFQILAAGNGKQAISMVKSEKPDLMILDLMMPEMDGLEVARRLRADPQTEDLPIIMFTAKVQLDDKLVGFEAGADDYLTKPVQPSELIAHVRAVLKRTHRPGGERPKLPKHRGHMIGILSAKGGVGVSTVATNLGITLKKHNRDVIVADFRPGCGTIRLELGIEQPNGLVHLLNKDPFDIRIADIEAELVTHETQVRFLLSSATPSDARYCGAVEHFETIAENLAFMAPMVLLDLGASLTPINDKVLGHCDSVIVVLEPIPQSVKQTRALIDNLIARDNIHKERIDIALINRMRTGLQLPFGEVQDQLGYGLSVIFTPVPELAFKAQDIKRPMVVIQPDGLTAEQYDSLADLVAQKIRRLV